MDFTAVLCVAFALFVIVVVVLPNLMEGASGWEPTSPEEQGEGENPDFTTESSSLLGTLSPFVNDRPYGYNLSRSPIYSSSRRTSHRSDSRRNTESIFSWFSGSDSGGSGNWRSSSSSSSSFGNSRSYSSSNISTRGGFGSSRSSSRSSSFGKSRSYGGTRSGSSFSSRSSSSSRSRSSSSSSSKPKTMKKSSSFKK